MHYMTILWRLYWLRRRPFRRKSMLPKGVRLSLQAMPKCHRRGDVDFLWDCWADWADVDVERSGAGSKGWCIYQYLSEDSAPVWRNKHSSSAEDTSPYSILSRHSSLMFPCLGGSHDMVMTCSVDFTQWQESMEDQPEETDPRMRKQQLLGWFVVSRICTSSQHWHKRLVDVESHCEEFKSEHLGLKGEFIIGYGPCGGSRVQWWFHSLIWDARLEKLQHPGCWSSSSWGTSAWAMVLGCLECLECHRPVGCN